MPDSDLPEEREPRAPRALTRRELIAGAAGAVGAAMVQNATALSGQQQPIPMGPPPGPRPVAPEDPTRVPGPPVSAVGQRSPYERPQRISFNGTSSRTPLQDLHGTLTPTDLHFERHHGGVPMIDPERYTLLIHGMVERPMVFTLAELKRFPSVTRTHFLECSGNFRTNANEEATPQEICGLTSQNEWTGVLLSTLFREVGADRRATWFLAEGSDAGMMERSIPMEKGWEDAMIAYAQNGEALRPENGYPARLFLPGYEGNANVKWLRRLEVTDAPVHTRNETSTYTDPLKDGTARQFSLVMDARSVITWPNYPHTLQRGWQEIRGIAWSGRGKIARVDVSTDDGKTWSEAVLQEPVLPIAHTRFTHLVNWDGRPTAFLSRAIDETGYVQPTVSQLVEARGPGTSYHLNPITGVRVDATGRVTYRTEKWG